MGKIPLYSPHEGFDLVSYGSPGTKNKRCPHWPRAGRCWNCLSKQHSQGCQKRPWGGGGGEEEAGGRDSVCCWKSLSSLCLRFTPLFSTESQHPGWIFTSGYITELFTRYNLPRDWSCWEGRNGFQDPPSTGLHLSAAFHKALARWRLRKGGGTITTPLFRLWGPWFPLHSLESRVPVH